MRMFTAVIVFLLLSSVFFGVCQGVSRLNNTDDNQGVWLALYSEEAKHRKINVEGLDFISSRLTLYETSENVILTIGVLATHSNFETWLTIDDQAPEKLIRNRVSRDDPRQISEYIANLSSLSDGVHSIKIRASGITPYNRTFDCSGVTFLVIDNHFPTIRDISIKNNTYTEKNLELNYTTNEPFSWIAYSLDNQGNVTIRQVPQNVTIHDPLTQAKTYLTNLTEGTHTLTLYAEDTAGNKVASQTIIFTVDLPKPFLAASIIAVVSATTACAIVLLTRRRRRNIT